MIRITLPLFFLLVIVNLFSCSVSVNDYQHTKPQFKLDEFFNGELKAWGVFEDYSGKVVRRFRVDMTGQWNGNLGVLDEDFYYADGKQQKRIWRLTKVSENEYIGEADDVIGIAYGKAAGFALNWRYQLALTIEQEEYHLHFNDWMYMVDEFHVINVADVSKFGVKVGKVTLFIQKANSSHQVGYFQN